MSIQVRDAENPSILWTFDLANNTRTMTDPVSGRLVTMDLGTADVHIDAALATYASGYQDVADRLIADQVIPILPVDKKSNKFFTWDRNDVTQDVQSLEVAAGGAVAEISPRLSNSSYVTTSYGVQCAVSTELQANADSALSPERQAMVRCITAINFARERRAAALAMTSGNWTGGFVRALDGTTKWNGGASSNPIGDLFAAIEASLTDIGGIVMSERTYHDFIQNAQVQKYVASKTAVAPLPNASSFSAILELPPIIVGRRKGNTSASAFGYVWGDNVALIKADAGIPSGGASISTARTFRWTGANGGSPDGTVQGGFLVRSYFDPKRGPRGSKVVVVCHDDAEVMTSTIAGGLITGAHQ